MRRDELPHPQHTSLEAQTERKKMADETQPLITITEKAAAKMKEIMTTEQIDPSARLRLRVIGGGCSGFSYDMFFDLAADNPDDKVFEQYGVKVVVDVMSFQYIVGTEIDYTEGLTGAGFKFDNPNVKATCGCGSSFST